MNEASRMKHRQFNSYLFKEAKPLIKMELKKKEIIIFHSDKENE